MSNSNIHITDEEMRSMLNTLLLSTNTSEPINNNLIDMETSIIFSQPEMHLFGAPKDKELIQKLNKDFNNGFNLKWLLALLFTLVTFGITYYVLKPVKSELGATVVVSKSMNNTKEASKMPSLKDTKMEVQKQSIDLVNKPNNQLPVPTKAITFATKDSNEIAPFADNNSGTYSDEKIHTYPTANSEEMNLPAPLVEKQFPIDTFFNGVKRIEIVGSYIPVYITQNATEKLSIKGLVGVEAKGKKSKNTTLEVKYEKVDEVLKVYIQLKEKTKWISTGSISITGFLNFAIPKYCDLVVNNISGDINVNGMSGKICDLQSKYGSIKASNIAVPIKVQTTSGNIKLDEISNMVDAHSDYGNMDLVNIKGDLILFCASGNVHLEGLTGNSKIDSKYGNVTATNITGDAVIKAQSGNIDLEHLVGKICKINDSYGNIGITDVKAEITIDATSGNVRTEKTVGKLDIHSHYGSQRVMDCKGNIVSMSNSGDAIFKNVEGNMDLESLYGDVNISDSKGNADISLKSGNIKMKNYLVVDSIKIMNGYGDIRLKLLNAETDLSYNLETTTGDISFDKQPEKNKAKKGALVINGGRIWINANTSTGDIIID